MVTPFDEASVDLALEHEVDILKVASCSATRLAPAGGHRRGGQARHLLDRRQDHPRHRQDRQLLRPPLREGPGPAPLRGPLPDPQRAGADALHAADAAALPAAAGGLQRPRGSRQPGRGQGGGGAGRAHPRAPRGPAPRRRRRSTPTRTDPAQTAAWVEAALRMREICGAGARQDASRPRRSARSTSSPAAPSRGGAIKAGEPLDPRRRVLRHALRRGPDHERRVRRTA